MSSQEIFPLNPGERARMVNGIIAAKAFELWSKGIDFIDIPDEPEFQEATAGLYDSNLQAAASQLAAEPIRTMRDSASKRRELLMSQGLSEAAARRQVRGETLERFVKNLIGKITTNLEEE